MNRRRVLIAAYAAALVAARVGYSPPASAEYAGREAVTFLWHPADIARWHNVRRTLIDVAGVALTALVLARATSRRPADATTCRLAEPLAPASRGGSSTSGSPG